MDKRRRIVDVDSVCFGCLGAVAANSPRPARKTSEMIDSETAEEVVTGIGDKYV